MNLYSDINAAYRQYMQEANVYAAQFGMDPKSMHNGEWDAFRHAYSSAAMTQDFNQDAVTQDGELKTLAELGIVSIAVAATEHSRILPGGNEIADLGSFTRSDGSTGSAGLTAGLADVNLAVDTFHREFSDSIPLTAATELLPDMQGSGLLRDLREAASLPDATGDILLINLGPIYLRNESGQTRWRLNDLPVITNGQLRLAA